MGMTAEPIDLCLEKQLITHAQHWCGLHLRWLYTLRYGAPSLSTHYGDKREAGLRSADDPAWRKQREAEYHEATALLRTRLHYEPVMRLTVYNELPSFLNPVLCRRAWDQPSLAEQLSLAQRRLTDGLELLALHWQRRG
jgi:hypothetical protein